ncbi:hypothetical protein ACA910_008254 [Epithemia clementina (nom. ined.)]
MSPSQPQQPMIYNAATALDKDGQIVDKPETPHHNNNNIKNNNDEQSLLRLLAQASALQREGVNLGIYGARIYQSMEALNACQDILKLVMVLSTTTTTSSSSSSLSPVCCNGDMKWRDVIKTQALHHMIRVCIHQAELHLVLFQYEPVKTACQQALIYHQELEAALTAKLVEAHKEPCMDVEDNEMDDRSDDGSDDNNKYNNKNEKDELDVLKADIYRCLSIVDYRLGDDQHKYWDLEGTSLLEQVVARDPNNERAKSLLALFWSYQITTGDVDTEKAVQDSIKAIDWLGALYEQQQPASTTDAEDREVHARRLSVVLRLASYAFRDMGRHEESMEAIRGALDVIQALCRQRPCAVIYLFELYHCQCALAEHMELMAGSGASIHDGGDDLFVLEARKDAVAALTRLTELLPNVPKYWRSLCTSLIDVADLQERNGAGQAALESSEKALQAAAKCRSCFPLYTITSTPGLSSTMTQAEPKFEDEVEYARALLERGRHLYIQKLHEQALPFYEQALDVYTTYVLNHDRAQREDEFYVELILRSMQAASSCATMCIKTNASNEDGNDNDSNSNVHNIIMKAIWFLDQARAVRQERGGVKLRKNKVLAATLLLELAELQFMKNNNPTRAIQILRYELLEGLIAPLRREHPWHVTVGTVYGDANMLLTKCYRATGNVQLEIETSRAYLRYAGERHGKDYSFWIGDDPTTNDDEEWDEDKLRRLREVCDTEVPAIKKYRLPVRNQMGQVSWYSLEVGSAIPDQDPLEDQARVWKEDHGLEIAEDIRDSFRKLHDLALSNNVPMTDLCDYALSGNTGNNASFSSPSGSTRQRDGTNGNDERTNGDEDAQNEDGTVSTAAESVSVASEQEEVDDDGDGAQDHELRLPIQRSSSNVGCEEEQTQVLNGIDFPPREVGQES